MIYEITQSGNIHGNMEQRLSKSERSNTAQYAGQYSITIKGRRKIIIKLQNK